MKRRMFIYVFFLLLYLVSCRSDNEQTSDLMLVPDPDNGGLTLPNGFRALIVADNLGYGRHIVVRENGDIYMRLRRLNNGSGIVCLRDTTDDGKADIITYFGTTAGTGLDIHKKHLYVSSYDEIRRYPLKEQDLTPGADFETIATGFPEQNQHRDKPFTFDKTGNIYVNVGAPSNACMEQTRTPGSQGLDPCPQLDRQAGIWRFRDDIPDQKQEKDGYRFATGIRNSIALTWNQKTDFLYIVMHGRDQLFHLFPDLYTVEDGINLPAEEFLLVEEGADFGWPYCYYDHYLNEKVLSPEYKGDGKIAGRCADTDDPIMAFPAHLAPNDLLFYHSDQFPQKYKNGAFIAFHGSWNRAPQEQEGYFVVFVPFEGSIPSGDWDLFADGFSGTDVVMSPRDAEYRPMGLAVGPDGSLYVCDSRKGRIWRIWYAGQ